MHRPFSRLLGLTFTTACLLGVSVGALSPGLTQAQPASMPRHAVTGSRATHLLAGYARLPLRFEANQGQSDSRVRFLAHGAGYTLFLAANEAVLSLAAAQPHHSGATGPAVLRLRLLGANPHPAVVGLDRLPGTSNYFIGRDRRRWHSDVPAYAQVAYRRVYPGIDLLYHGNQGRLEYDFVMAPGAVPGAIRLAVSGAVRPRLDRGGNLLLQTSTGTITQQRPLVYQQVNGRRRLIAGHYVLAGSHTVGFALARYNTRRPLVIDPVLSYSTYLGGTGDDGGYGIAVDAHGSAYVTGVTASNNFPVVNAAQLRNIGGSGSYDAFVAKLNPAGSALAYCTYLGGSGVDAGQGIAVDEAGNAYVTGYTYSPDFTLFNALQVRKGGQRYDGTSDAFVAKLDPTGGKLVYSTYLGGKLNDGGSAIATNSAGDAYVTGYTQSRDFPTRDALQSACASCDPKGILAADAFVVKLAPDGGVLLYGTFLGGAGEDRGYGIAVDSTRDIYVTGVTASANFPQAVALQGAAGGDTDAFVVRLNAAGSALLYSDLLGGRDRDEGRAIAVDGQHNAYVTGWTSSTNFPTTPGAAQPGYAGGNRDAFVAKINAAGTRLVYSTLLGGSDDSTLLGANDDEAGNGIAVDSAGEAYVTGKTASNNFPTTRDALQRDYAGGGHDAFLSKLNAAGTAFLYSTYLGGADDDVANGVAVDGAGNAYITGVTASSDYPSKAGAAQPALRGGYHDVFVTEIGNVVAPTVRGYLPNVAPPATGRGTLFVPAANHTVAVPFVATYRTLAATLGHPVTEAYVLNGVPTQDFDHMQLQLRGATVVIGNLGSEVFNQQLRYDARLAAAARGVAAQPNTPTSLYFPDKRHLLQGDLLKYWRAHGGLAVFGAPISEMLRDGNGDGSRRMYHLQWFQKARIELHPENSNPRYRILLGLLGNQALHERGWTP